ncbi:MAG: TIGR03747 family integrating conjugative element membrane protein, partial [Gammaproteobacteria bacterium]|nr:TIGR03747 family integrating conjugative element membrane protein [Gammaproteobacteria bacterium]
MAETAVDPRQRVVQEGLISKGLTTVAKIIKWLLLSLLFSIIIEWIGMVLWWPEEGTEHSRAMLAKEISYLDSDFRRSVVTSDPAQFAKRFADNSYHYLFEVTRFVDFIRWISPQPSINEEGIRPILHNTYLPISEYVIATMQVTQVFSVRMAILTLAMPVFLLFSLVALIDG